MKAEEDRVKARHHHGGSSAAAAAADQSKKRKRETGLFDPPEEGTTPVTPKHVREAFRRLQEKPLSGRCTVWMGPRSQQKTELKLVCDRSIHFLIDEKWAYIFPRSETSSSSSVIRRQVEN